MLVLLFTFFVVFINGDAKNQIVPFARQIRFINSVVRKKAYVFFNKGLTFFNILFINGQSTFYPSELNYPLLLSLWYQG